MPPTLLESERVYHGHAFDVRRDRVRLPMGRVTAFDIVEHAGAVAMVPVDDQGYLWLVRQYRHATGKVILEIPAGTLEPGETPSECAARECREEIGMAAGRLTPLGEGFLAPGYSTEYMTFFLAQDLTPAPLEGDLDEDIQIEKVKLAQLPQLIASAVLQDVKTLAGLYLAQAALNAGG
jgi:ADP-ribose pyrophosphatase